MNIFAPAVYIPRCLQFPSALHLSLWCCWWRRVPYQRTWITYGPGCPPRKASRQLRRAIRNRSRSSFLGTNLCHSARILLDGQEDVGGVVCVVGIESFCCGRKGQRNAFGSECQICAVGIGFVAELAARQAPRGRHTTRNSETGVTDKNVGALVCVIRDEIRGARNKSHIPARRADDWRQTLGVGRATSGWSGYTQRGRNAWCGDAHAGVSQEYFTHD